MSLFLRDAQADDLDTILDLNRMAGVSVAAIDRSELEARFADASYFRVAEVESRVAAFLIGIDQSVTFGNAGFHWFQERHRAFLYIDRIIVAESFRGHGLGRVLYTDLISFAEVRAPVLGCQLSLEPSDDASVLFHGSLGFHEVAQLASPDRRRIGVMERRLCSFDFVRDHYLGSAGGLPDLPWLSTRRLPEPSSHLRIGAA